MRPPYGVSSLAENAPIVWFLAVRQVAVSIPTKHGCSQLYRVLPRNFSSVDGSRTVGADQTHVDCEVGCAIGFCRMCWDAFLNSGTSWPVL